MADEQQESTEKNELTAHASDPNNNAEEVAAMEGDEKPNEEHGEITVDSPVGVIQAEGDIPDQGMNMAESKEEAAFVAEQQSSESEKLDVAQQNSSSGLGDQTDMNRDLSNQDQEINQQSQDSDPDVPGQNVNSGSESQNGNSDESNQHMDIGLPSQDPDVGPQDQDLNGGPPNQNSDSESPPQDPNKEPPSKGLNDTSPLDQDLKSNLPTSDPEETAEVQESGTGDDAEVDEAVSQPDQTGQDAVPVNEDVSENGAETVPASELNQTQAADSEQLVPAGNTGGLPEADVNQVVDPENTAADLADQPNGLTPSPQSPTQEQTVAGNTEDIAADAADNPDEASPSPSPPVQEQALANNTLGSLQQNNNNELTESGHFIDGPVHIPTAGVGDFDEPMPNGEVEPQEDLRHAVVHDHRSSLPLDAYGDSKSQHLPALIHPDPRLSRSLPASMDHSHIPNSYPHSGSSSQRGPHWTRTHIPRIPSASGSTKADTREGDVRRALTSARLPPSVMKMSTVMVSARKRAVLNRNASVFYEEKQHHKVISLDQAINSRPPMPFDLDGPGPWSYSPRNKPLNENNAPEYTFGHRLNEKGGGGRTAYSKTWFNSNNGFTQKVHFEKRWPSPAHYNSTRSLLGRRKQTMLDYPAFSIGVRANFSISKRGSENEPAPNEYNRSKSDPVILRRAPSHTISHRHQGTKLWSGNELTPGPGTYTPRWGFSSGTVHHPSFTIQGVRRTKSHQLGPHSTF